VVARRLFNAGGNKTRTVTKPLLQVASDEIADQLQQYFAKT
jgi:hypothetical protein